MWSITLQCGGGGEWGVRILKNFLGWLRSRSRNCHPYLENQPERRRQKVSSNIRWKWDILLHAILLQSWAQATIVSKRGENIFRILACQTEALKRCRDVVCHKVKKIVINFYLVICTNASHILPQVLKSKMLQSPCSKST